MIYIKLSLLLLLTSCAGYMNSLYSELDQGEQQKQYRRSGNKFDIYRPRQRSNEPISTTTQNRVLPKVQRSYQPAEQIKKRYTANDLTDSKGDGSLWGGEGNQNYLFSNQKARRAGDIVLINIMAKFKKEISLELARVFPSSSPISTGVKKDEKGTKAPAAPAPAQPQDDDDDSAPVYDRISGIVVEEINRDHLLIKGRKDLLYKKKKRTIEIQALVPKRDINDNDEVDSNSFLESTIQILR